MKKPVSFATSNKTIACHFKVGGEPAIVAMDKGTHRIVLTGPLGAGHWPGGFREDMIELGFVPTGETFLKQALVDHTLTEFEASLAAGVKYERLNSSLEIKDQSAAEKRFVDALAVFEKHQLAPEGATEQAKTILGQNEPEAATHERGGDDTAKWRR